ncbi:MAG TPA: hypothetical protein VF813_05710, partial [Anaerolineaceae bacterium]
IPDLFWWSNETISQNSQTGRTPGLYPLYLSFQNFMDGIPLSNGQFRDARAQTSNPLLRAWGQRDDANGQAFLWIQNRAHTWQAAVEGSAVPPLSGQVTLPEMPPGTYRITWWDTYNPANPILKTETASPSGGALTLVLPAPLTADIAVKIARQCFFSPAIYPFVDIKCN